MKGLMGKEEMASSGGEPRSYTELEVPQTSTMPVRLFTRINAADLSISLACSATRDKLGCSHSALGEMKGATSHDAR